MSTEELFSKVSELISEQEDYKKNKVVMSPETRKRANSELADLRFAFAEFAKETVDQKNRLHSAIRQCDVQINLIDGATNAMKRLEHWYLTGSFYIPGDFHDE
jgi:uncharacterized protein YrzB (UPF0473 family)